MEESLALAPVAAERAARRGVPLAVALTTALAAGGTAFYRRPFATLRAVLRWTMLARGARERVAVVRGLPVRYLEQGPAGGKTLVLLHGLGDAAETWVRVLPALARGCRVVAPDLAGFGRTPLPPEGMSLTVLTDYLAGLLDAVGVARAAMVGNSLGGAVAIRYAARYPARVSRLFLLDSAIYPQGRSGLLAPLDRAAARELVAISGRARRLPGFILDDLVRRARQPARVAYLGSAEPTEVRPDLPRIAAIPATIIWGELDRLIPLTVGEFLRDALPNSELIVLPGVGHGPQTEAPQQVVRIIRERLGLGDPRARRAG